MNSLNRMLKTQALRSKFKPFEQINKNENS